MEKACKLPGPSMTHADVDLNLKLGVLVLNHHESLYSIYRFRGFQPPTLITNIPSNIYSTPNRKLEYHREALGLAIPGAGSG